MKIRSTNIAEADYSNGVMTVRFHYENRVYTAAPVKESLFRAFLAAKSKGTFFNRWIKNRRDIKVQEVKHHVAGR